MRRCLSYRILVLSISVSMLINLTSCGKDYGDDINRLEKKVIANEKVIAAIKGQLQTGKWVKEVNPTSNGLKVTMGDGTVFNISNGDNGKPGSVVTIGKNGNWFIDGIDSGKPAKGIDGKDGINGKDGKDGINGKDGNDGANGKDGKDGINGKDGNDGANGKDGKDGINGKDGNDGANGKDGKDGINGKDGNDGVNGKDGIYYTPDEDGFWYKHENGTKTKTDQKWLTEGTITMVLDKAEGILRVHNVKGVDGKIRYNGQNLGYFLDVSL